MKRIAMASVLVTLICATLTTPAAAQGGTAQAATVLSAFFGLDDALPLNITGVCPGGANTDGMPVIFSQTVNADTLQPSDFTVITKSGVRTTPRCVTLTPAIDAGETRTALLIGNLGEADSDPPVTVEIAGDILVDDAAAANFKGASVAVTPIEAGPFLVFAEPVPQAQWKLDATGRRRQGSGCPTFGTIQVVRVIWAGGITQRNGDEIDDAGRELYRVSVTNSAGVAESVTPFALGDLDDGDNNHLLCLNVSGTPTSVSFGAGYLVDPNADAGNPATSVAIAYAAPMPTAIPARDARYCEVIPVYRNGLQLRAEVWNTLGYNDCPADQWNALNADALAQELGALMVNLNGPRYFLMDQVMARGETSTEVVYAFGGIDMAKRAELTLSRRNPEGQPYIEQQVDRNVTWVFYAGKPVFELVAPSGEVYVMQSYAQIVEKGLTYDQLAGIGARLTLPTGWTYRTRTAEQDLLVSAFGEAYVLQDDLRNTYQRLVTFN
jgi:hypothetical protein